MFESSELSLVVSVSWLSSQPMASKPILPTSQAATTRLPSPDQIARGATRRTTKAAHKLKVLPEQPEPSTQSKIAIGEEDGDGDDEEEEVTASESDAEDEEDEEVEVSALINHASLLTQYRSCRTPCLAALQANSAYSCWNGTKRCSAPNEERKSKTSSSYCILYRQFIQAVGFAEVFQRQTCLTSHRRKAVRRRAIYPLLL